MDCVEERMQPVRFVTVGFKETIELFMQIFNVVGNDVGQISVLGLIPYVLDGIEFRCICGKIFDSEPASARVVQVADS